jgi:tRNA pseudouridine32 synthase/23S rRNA pseudouridine746 synthase
VEKLYWAVLDGVPDAESGTIDIALNKTSTREAGWRIVPDPRGKAARTHWQVLGTQNGRALVAFQPETGRTHQIRVHAASGIGLPIVGDPLYGRAGPAMLLHARALSLPRANKAPIAAESPLPPSFAAAGFAAEPADART